MQGIVLNAVHARAPVRVRPAGASTPIRRHGWVRQASPAPVACTAPAPSRGPIGRAGIGAARISLSPSVPSRRATDPRESPLIPRAAAGDAGEIAQAEQKTIMRWRYFIFALLWSGYVVFYFNRLTFTFTAPMIQSDMGLTLQQIGRVTSVFPIMYGFSKFAAGVGADMFGSRLIFAVGLFATGGLNLAMGAQNALAGLTLLWAANGFFQGFGAPACAKLLTQWYPAKSRGTWWALWCTANNIGGFLSPIVIGSVAHSWGWRWAMMVPGLMAIATGVVLLLGIRNKPEDVGLPPANPPEKKESPKGASAPAATEDKASAKDILVKYVLRNKAIWALAFSYFFIYAIRQGFTSWTIYYLQNVKGVATPAEAARMFAPFELGGLFGGFLAGILSDKLNNYRIRVVLGYLALLAIVLVGFSTIPTGQNLALTAGVFCIGFLIYGPQMLIGLIGAELSHPLAVATGNGLLGWISYLGAAWAGEPLAILVKQHGWGHFFTAMLICCAVPFGLMLPFANARKYEDL